MDSGSVESGRITLNLRVDSEKFSMLEKMRKTGFGLAQTERKRSDVYNEIIGYGIQTQLLKKELGEREFEKVWRLLHNIDWQKLNLEKIETFFR